MAKIKVFELAKELKVESKVIINQLAKAGGSRRTANSALTEKEANAVRAALQDKNAPGNFVPRVKRIPKAVVEQERAIEAAENEAAAAASTSAEASPAQDAPAQSAPAQSAPAQDAPAQDASVQSAPKVVPAADTPAKVEPKAEVKASEKAAEKAEAPAPAKEAAKTESQAKTEPAPAQPAATEAKAPASAEAKAPEKAAEKAPVGDSAKTEAPAAEKAAETKEPAPATPKAEAAPQKVEPAKAAQPASAPAPRTDAERPQSSRDGQRPARDGERPQGNRDGQRPARDANRPQGSRDGQRPQGNRDGQRPQGGRDGQRPQGNRDGQRPQGNRDGQRPQGNRDGQRPQGGRDGQRPQGNRDGQRPSRPAGDKFAPAEKPNSNYRPNNNKKAYVKDMVAERDSRAESKGRGFNKNAKQGRPGKGKKGEPKQVMPPVTPKKITIGETVVLGELAKTMGKTAAELIKRLFTMGMMATINQELDSDTAILLGDEFGVTVEVRADRAAEILEDVTDDEEDLVERPPVVTIMGHVDHGKTSLLDAIRHTNVVSGEAGGITQHIGAYQVEINGKKITFLDTPGHEAFTAMRARGANMTDIAIIVVAADDGVMPQTIEAINHSKAAGVPIIIAINKIDKPGANPDRVKQELMEHGLVCEEWGGDTIMVPVSAKARMNIENLLEMILLVAEVGELKANPDRLARGVIVEAKLDPHRGPVATLLVQKGTLHPGDNLLAGPVFGKVRAMFDDKGRKAKQAGPSMPVEVTGFSEVPEAGGVFMVVKDEKDARMVAAKEQLKQRDESMRKTSKVTLDDLFNQISQGEIKDLNIILKADVRGSAEAVAQSLNRLSTDEVRVNVIHSGVGGVSESDVMLAAASNAIIIGFNIIAPPAARAAAEAEQVDIRLYRVIYDCLEDIKKAMSGLLAPEYKENIIGTVEVRNVIHVPKVGFIAGSYVASGKVTRSAQVRITRDSVVIAEDKIASLRRFKDDVKEVVQGYECGIGLETFNDLKEGDVFEVFVIEEIAREI
ncbi:MAG: translation initiation factor IF-2 [Firmicutes bacterium]|nr:translation initiation factor IF-2 [Bacillota bacterium]